MIEQEYKHTNIRLPYDTWRGAKIISIDTGESINAMIVRLLEDEIKRQTKNNQKNN